MARSQVGSGSPRVWDAESIEQFRGVVAEVFDSPSSAGYLLDRIAFPRASRPGWGVKNSAEFWGETFRLLPDRVPNGLDRLLDATADELPGNATVAALLARLPVGPAGPAEDDLVRSAADVVVRIERIGQEQVRWVFSAPAAVAVPPPVERRLAGTAEFAKALMLNVDSALASPGLAGLLTGKGVQIRQQVPAEFWQLLRDVARLLDRPPTVLLVTDVGQVPWELAAMPAPLLDDTAPAHLHCQAAVGRRVFTTGNVALPEPTDRPVRRIATITGHYAKLDDPHGPGPLPSAEREARHLRDRYGAEAFEATWEDVHACLRDDPRYDVVHIACHGLAEYDDPEAGLALVTGPDATGRYRTDALKQEHVLSFELGVRRPFVFVNACQVGTGRIVLGNYTGMAVAFLDAGARAVLASLWSVFDDAAHDLAVEIYRRAFGGEPLGEVLRDLRCRSAGSPTAATALAYQLYGDPTTVLRYDPA